MRSGGWSRLLAGTVVALATALGLTACAAAPRPDVSAPPAPSSTAPVVVPDDGVSLAALGLTTGPVTRVFVPVGAQVSSRVDQPNNVAVVLTAPSAGELYTFYARSVVANGFTLTAHDEAATTLEFTGFGWTGTFTGDEQASALLLRPAA